MAKTITPALSDHRSASRAAAASQANSWRKRQRLWWMLFIVPAVVVYVIFMAMPLINSMGLSFYTGEGLRPERFVGLDNYIQLFTGTVLRERFFNALRNTFVFFSIHMIVQNSLGLFFALLLNSQIRGRNIYRTIIFAPATMSVLVTGFLWSLILNPQWGAAKKNIGSLRDAIGGTPLAWGYANRPDDYFTGLLVAMGGAADDDVPCRIINDSTRTDRSRPY